MTHCERFSPSSCSVQCAVPQLMLRTLAERECLQVPRDFDPGYTSGDLGANPLNAIFNRRSYSVVVLTTAVDHRCPE